MKYHAPTKSLTIGIRDVERAAYLLREAIKEVRKMAKRPMTPYSRDGELQRDDFAMKTIIDAANALGIDLGAEWGNEIDVSDTD